jgi:hypothetical protein
MSLWLLEAKVFLNDTRSKAATSSLFWLNPGTYTVGRKEGQCDVDVPEDTSISRIHAEIKVPSTEELRQSPYITVTDKSKFGTYVNSENKNLNGTGQIGTVQNVGHRWFVRWGYQSIFRYIKYRRPLILLSSSSLLFLLHYAPLFLLFLCYLFPYRVKKIDWSIVLHPNCTQETLTLATELGFTILADIDDNVSENNHSQSATYLIMPHSEAPLDGLSLKATMSGRPVISVEWLLKWKERKVWKNKHPDHKDYLIRFTNSARLPPEVVLEKARDAVERQPLKNLSFFFFKPEEKEERVDGRIYLGLQSATALAGGKLGNWPTSATKAPKRIKKSCVLVLPSKQHYHHVPAYLKMFKWITYDSLTLGIINDRIDTYIIDPELHHEKVSYPLGTVPDSEDETEAIDMNMNMAAPAAAVEEEEEEEAVSKKGVAKAMKAAITKQSHEKSPSIATTRSKRKIDTSEVDLEVVSKEKKQQQEAKSRKEGRRNPPTVAVAADDSPAPSKRQKTQGGRGASIAASQKGSIALKSPSSAHSSPIKKGRKETTTKIAPPLVVDAPFPDPVLKPQAPAAAAEIKSTNKAVKASNASVSPSPGKRGSQKAHGNHASIVVVPRGEGWNSVASAKKKKTGEQEGRTRAGAITGQEATFPTHAAIPPSISNAAPGVEEKETITCVTDVSAVIMDTSLIAITPFTDVVHDNDDDYGVTRKHEGGGGFKAFRRKCSTARYGNGGTARLPKIPFATEPYREGQGYKAEVNDEFLREEAENKAALEAADALFNANLKPKRDKKALDEGKRKLLAMLPEASRRRLG